MNPHMRKTVAKAMVRKRGTTAIARQTHAKKRFANPSSIKDIKFKERFDKEKSWIENMKTVNLGEMYSESLPETIASKAKWTLPKLNDSELAVAQKLVAVHGDSNFRKMFFDRTLNKFQWTEEQCQKKVNLLLQQGRVHICEEGRCLCGNTPNSSYVARKDRIRR